MQVIGAAKRTVAYRLDQSGAHWQGFSCRLFLASQLSSRTSSVERRRGRNKISPCFSLLAPHIRLAESFWLVSEGPSLLKETQHSKCYFCRWSSLGSHTQPAGFKEQPAFCARDLYNHSWRTRHDRGIIRPHHEGRAWRPDDSRIHDGRRGYG